LRLVGLVEVAALVSAADNRGHEHRKCETSTGARHTGLSRFASFSLARDERGNLCGMRLNMQSVCVAVRAMEVLAHRLRGDQGMQPTPNICKVGNISRSCGRVVSICRRPGVVEALSRLPLLCNSGYGSWGQQAISATRSCSWVMENRSVTYFCIEMNGVNLLAMA
jgi:hypothetical protein